jgi:hypothetical protein
VALLEPVAEELAAGGAAVATVAAAGALVAVGDAWEVLVAGAAVAAATAAVVPPLIEGVAVGAGVAAVGAGVAAVEAGVAAVEAGGGLAAMRWILRGMGLAKRARDARRDAQRCRLPAVPTACAATTAAANAGERDERC